MKEQLAKIAEIGREEFSRAADMKQLEDLRIKYLSRRGELRAILSGMGKLDPEQRPLVGQWANDAQKALEEAYNERKAFLTEAEKQRRLQEETLDISLPGTQYAVGHAHPLNLIYDRIIDIFISMGFEVLEGREIETDYYNYEALNVPKDHPARDMQDSFYITDDWVLRTHTSPMQIHAMEEREPNTPIKIVCPGRVYRRDDDATHSPMFHQIEGLVVGPNITMADLTGTLELFFRNMFSPDTTVRLRPSFFPFTEPSTEVDITCIFCHGRGCSVCKRTGWIELLGAGMVHPKVLRNVGYDPEKVNAFAFGMGIDRITMLAVGINDLRQLFTNDLKMIRQF